MINYLTQDEIYQLSEICMDDRLDIMELYLIGKNGYRYNMQEVGECIYGDKNRSFRVSLIHRAYNFSDRNSGRYRPGCQFEKNYNYRVSREDISAFIHKYPNGTHGTDITFDSFLLSRVNKYQNSYQEKQYDINTSVKSGYNHNKNNPTNVTNGFKDTLISVAYFVLFIAGIIFLIRFFTNRAFRQDVIGLIFLAAIIIAIVLIVIKWRKHKNKK